MEHVECRVLVIEYYCQYQAGHGTKNSLKKMIHLAFDANQILKRLNDNIHQVLIITNTNNRRN